jgi:polyferredoxin
MSDQPPVSSGRVFRYTSIACEILVFALVGFIIGPVIFGPGGEVLGTLIGAIIGTFMMFCTLFYLAGIFERKSKEA